MHVNSSVRETIRKTQRIGEDCITGSLRTTPSDALDIILDLLLLEIRGVQVATLSPVKLREASL